MKVKTDSDHAVIEEILPHGSQSQDEKVAPATDQIIARPPATCRNFIRHFCLQFLPLLVGSLPRWRIGKENRKVAMYQSRWVATINSLLHLLPLGGAIVLLTLQWTSYIVSLQNDDSTTLQFVAKLYELLMQTSIAEIVVCIIRTESVKGFVPLGMLFGIDRAMQFSYLWSPGFWSTLQASVLRGWRKILFLISIFVLILLTPLIGPSSAIWYQAPGELWTVSQGAVRMCPSML
ncbi:hypothetical protein DE146DRAFT_639324 [Phaeosphaeria sp. MPI-PUGE-AT-0046c]|nr:hypothetical protein DE146DRAFT_639324 [Phaeosphaeria sp. MPI-PUGE-AT-0046c]